MAVEERTERRHAVCISNQGYEASLEQNKLYALIPDERAAADGLLRVVDEDGEGYLYPSGWFVTRRGPQGRSGVGLQGLLTAARRRRSRRYSTARSI